MIRNLGVVLVWFVLVPSAHAAGNDIDDLKR
jgi:hypothetical protein